MDGYTGDNGAENLNKPSTSRGGCIRKSRSPAARLAQLLPPIPPEDMPSCSGRHLPMFQTHKEDKTWSRFHSGCQPKSSMYLDWTSERIGKKSPGAIPKTSRARSISSFKDAESQDVVKFLDHNKDLLEAYVFDRVPEEVLEKWVQKKIKWKNTTFTSSSYKKQLIGKKTNESCTSETFMGLLRAIEDDPNEHSILLALATYIANSVNVDAHRVFKLYTDHPSFVQFFVVDIQQSRDVVRGLVRAYPEQVQLVLEVASSGMCRRISRDDDSVRFPETPVTLFRSMGKHVKQANHVMYQPIFMKNGKTAYVIEMWRLQERFTLVDEQISSNFMVLSSLALYYCNMYLDKTMERTMSEFLLEVVRAIFEEMVSLEQLIKRILEFVQRLVNADRASLFLVDYRNFELVSTVFDLRYEPRLEGDLEKKEIRMPINKGIAGHVALTGETLNIPDAYADYRFNREVDEATGYKTVSILCMPIKVKNRVIGVVQMVNKRDDISFAHEDEVHFGLFSTFFGLALHHARLYDRIMRKEQKYRVALEVLSYHNTCKEFEVAEMLMDQNPIMVDLIDYYLDPYKIDEFRKCKYVITMFRSLFTLDNFEVSTLTRFVLTVKKNYRNVPYHNFDHGWTVAHSMFVMLKHDIQNRFDFKMRLALFVACLCHDLDHRGYTNKYMSEIASPLAAMYTTSTLEHHHFNITVTILQQEGHNIFSHISSDDYKVILGYIRHCILATDLAVFFPNLAKITQLHEGEVPAFNWNQENHMELAMAISMTAADLSASAKPWDIQLKTVRVIFEEFYDQGDKERAAGKVPIPMMDRNKPEQQPSSQVDFLSQICISCYEMLYRILPNTKPMYFMALRNLERWKATAESIETNLPLLDFETDNNIDDDSPSISDVDELEDPMSKLVIVEDIMPHENVSSEEEGQDIAGSLLSGEMNRNAMWYDGNKWIIEEEDSELDAVVPTGKGG